MLDVNLRAQHGKIKGIIKNLSEYPIENPSILVDGLFSPLQPIKGGEEVSIEIPDEDLSQRIKILGHWKRPILKLKESNLSLQEETTIILYHL